MYLDQFAQDEDISSENFINIAAKKGKSLP